MDQGVFESPCSQVSILPFADAIADDLAIPAVDDNDSVAPAGILAEEVGHIGGPAFVDGRAHGSRCTGPGTEALGTYIHSPAVSLHDPLDLLPVHDKPCLVFKHHRDSAVAIAGIALDQRIDGLLDSLVHERRSLAVGFVVHTGPGYPKPLGDLPQADLLALKPPSSSSLRRRVLVL